MKNVTIALDEKTAAWARAQAAKCDMSLSRFVGELLEQRMNEAREYRRAMRRYLSKEPVALKPGGARYPRRGDLHDRSRLR